MDSLLLTGVAFFLSEVVEDFCLTASLVSTSPRDTTHCSNGIHNGSQGSKTDGSKQGYQNPPVPRLLVCHSHIPPSLSPAYADLSSSVPGITLGSKHGAVRNGTQADLCISRRLPLRPQRGQGQKHWQTLSLKLQEFLTESYCWVRQLMLLMRLLTATEKQVKLGQLYMRPIQWHLKNHCRILESLVKVIPRSLHPHLKWWLQEANVLKGQPVHPLTHTLQIFTDASSEGWGAHV